MIKKLSLLLAAAAVVALAVPALANAAKLTMPANTLVPIGTEITGRSINAKTTTSLGVLVCEEVVVNGEITKNNGTEVEGKGIGTGNTTSCEIEGGSGITITDITLKKIVAGPGGNKIEFTFIADLPSVTCHFETPAGGINFNYTSDSDTISVPEQKLTSTPAACRPGEFSGTFTLETTAGGEVTLD